MKTCKEHDWEKWEQYTSSYDAVYVGWLVPAYLRDKTLKVREVKFMVCGFMEDVLVQTDDDKFLL